MDLNQVTITGYVSGDYNISYDGLLVPEIEEEKLVEIVKC